MMILSPDELKRILLGKRKKPPSEEEQPDKLPTLEELIRRGQEIKIPPEEEAMPIPKESEAGGQEQKIVPPPKELTPLEIKPAPPPPPEALGVRFPKGIATLEEEKARLRKERREEVLRIAESRIKALNVKHILQDQLGTKRGEDIFNKLAAGTPLSREEEEALKPIYPILTLTPQELSEVRQTAFGMRGIPKPVEQAIGWMAGFSDMFGPLAPHKHMGGDLTKYFQVKTPIAYSTGAMTGGISQIFLAGMVAPKFVPVNLFLKTLSPRLSVPAIQSLARFITGNIAGTSRSILEQIPSGKIDVSKALKEGAKEGGFLTAIGIPTHMVPIYKTFGNALAHSLSVGTVMAGLSYAEGERRPWALGLSATWGGLIGLSGWKTSLSIFEQLKKSYETQIKEAITREWVDINFDLRKNLIREYARYSSPETPEAIKAYYLKKFESQFKKLGPEQIRTKIQELMIKKAEIEKMPISENAKIEHLHKLLQDILKPPPIEVEGITFTFEGSKSPSLVEKLREHLKTARTPIEGVREFFEYEIKPQFKKGLGAIFGITDINKASPLELNPFFSKLAQYRASQATISIIAEGSGLTEDEVIEGLIRGIFPEGWTKETILRLYHKNLALIEPMSQERVTELIRKGINKIVISPMPVNIEKVASVLERGLPTTEFPKPPFSAEMPTKTIRVTKEIDLSQVLRGVINQPVAVRLTTGNEISGIAIEIKNTLLKVQDRETKKTSFIPKSLIKEVEVPDLAKIETKEGEEAKKLGGWRLGGELIETLKGIQRGQRISIVHSSLGERTGKITKLTLNKTGEVIGARIITDEGWQIPISPTTIERFRLIEEKAPTPTPPIEKPPEEKPPEEKPPEEKPPITEGEPAIGEISREPIEIEKTPEEKSVLRELKFTDEQIDKMTTGAKQEIIEKRLTAEQVSILPTGDIKIIKKPPAREIGEPKPAITPKLKARTQEKIPPRPRGRTWKPTEEYLDSSIYSGKGYFTDTMVLVKGTPPPQKQVKPMPDIVLEKMPNLLNRPTEPVKLLHYFYNGEGFQTLASSPVANIPKKKSLPPAYVVFETKEGKKHFFSQHRFNVISNRYPDATFGVSKEGILIAYRDKEPVAALAPLREGILASQYEKYIVSQKKGREIAPPKQVIKPSEEKIPPRPIKVKEKIKPEPISGEDIKNWDELRGDEKDLVSMALLAPQNLGITPTIRVYPPNVLNLIRRGIEKRDRTLLEKAKEKIMNLAQTPARLRRAMIYMEHLPPEKVAELQKSFLENKAINALLKTVRQSGKLVFEGKAHKIPSDRIKDIETSAWMGITRAAAEFPKNLKEKGLDKYLDYWQRYEPVLPQDAPADLQEEWGKFVEYNIRKELLSLIKEGLKEGKEELVRLEEIDEEGVERKKPIPRPPRVVKEIPRGLSNKVDLWLKYNQGEVSLEAKDVRILKREIGNEIDTIIKSLGKDYTEKQKYIILASRFGWFLPNATLSTLREHIVDNILSQFPGRAYEFENWLRDEAKALFLDELPEMKIDDDMVKNLMRDIVNKFPPETLKKLVVFLTEGKEKIGKRITLALDNLLAGKPTPRDLTAVWLILPNLWDITRGDYSAITDPGLNLTLVKDFNETIALQEGDKIYYAKVGEVKENSFVAQLLPTGERREFSYGDLFLAIIHKDNLDPEVLEFWINQLSSDAQNQVGRQKLHLFTIVPNTKEGREFILALKNKVKEKGLGIRIFPFATRNKQTLLVFGDEPIYENMATLKLHAGIDPPKVGVFLKIKEAWRKLLKYTPPFMSPFEQTLRIAYDKNNPNIVPLKAALLLLSHSFTVDKIIGNKLKELIDPEYAKKFNLMLNRARILQVKKLERELTPAEQAEYDRVIKWLEDMNQLIAKVFEEAPKDIDAAIPEGIPKELIPKIKKAREFFQLIKETVALEKALAEGWQPANPEATLWQRFNPQTGETVMEAKERLIEQWGIKNYFPRVTWGEFLVLMRQKNTITPYVVGYASSREEAKAMAYRFYEVAKTTAEAEGTQTSLISPIEGGLIIVRVPTPKELTPEEIIEAIPEEMVRRVLASREGKILKEVAIAKTARAMRGELEKYLRKSREAFWKAMDDYLRGYVKELTKGPISDEDLNAAVEQLKNELTGGRENILLPLTPYVRARERWIKDPFIGLAYFDNIYRYLTAMIRRTQRFATRMKINALRFDERGKRKLDPKIDALIQEMMDMTFYPNAYAQTRFALKHPLAMKAIYFTNALLVRLLLPFRLSFQVGNWTQTALTLIPIVGWERMLSIMTKLHEARLLRKKIAGTDFASVIDIMAEVYSPPGRKFHLTLQGRNILKKMWGVLGGIVASAEKFNQPVAFAAGFFEMLDALGEYIDSGILSQDQAEELATIWGSFIQSASQFYPSHPLFEMPLFAKKGLRTGGLFLKRYPIFMGKLFATILLHPDRFDAQKFALAIATLHKHAPFLGIKAEREINELLGIPLVKEITQDDIRKINLILREEMGKYDNRKAFKHWTMRGRALLYLLIFMTALVGLSPFYALYQTMSKKEDFVYHYRWFEKQFGTIPAKLIMIGILGTIFDTNLGWAVLPTVIRGDIRIRGIFHHPAAVASEILDEGLNPIFTQLGWLNSLKENLIRGRGLVKALLAATWMGDRAELLWGDVITRQVGPGLGRWGEQVVYRVPEGTSLDKVYRVMRGLLNIRPLDEELNTRLIRDMKMAELDIERMVANAKQLGRELLEKRAALRVAERRGGDVQRLRAQLEGKEKKYAASIRKLQLYYLQKGNQFASYLKPSPKAISRLQELEAKGALTPEEKEERAILKHEALLPEAVRLWAGWNFTADVKRIMDGINEEIYRRTLTETERAFIREITKQSVPLEVFFLSISDLKNVLGELEKIRRVR